jgi:hypothetical protein
MKKIISIFITVFIIVASIVFYIDKEDMKKETVEYIEKVWVNSVDYVYKFSPYINPSYKKNKELIEPYFDKEWYENKYKELLKESGLSAIDHYLQRGWRGNWKRHCDPTPWFNVTLYKERLWPTNSDPFIDFLSQPTLTVSQNAEAIKVFTNEKQFERAWLAIEGLLRLNKFGINLILPIQFKDKIPKQFEHQIKRGLNVDFKDEHLNFYDSEFLKNPDKFSLTALPPQDNFIWDQMITRVKIGHEKECHWHQMYCYNSWKKNGVINPIFINIGNYTDEPIFNSKIALAEADFKNYIKRIAPAFDLLFLGPKIDLPNVKIIPGYMATWIDEMPEKKQFSVSFLLSRFETKQKEVLYNLRTDIFNQIKDVKNIPTRFYISRRVKGYPKEMEKYLLPTDSKKWIFESQFSIVIENTQQENYFTEKLLGCFETLTVPIYMGCPNIADYFDPRGMIVVNSLEEIKDAVAKLTPEHYEKMLPYIKINKEKTQNFLMLKSKLVEEFFNDISNH